MQKNTLRSRINQRKARWCHKMEKKLAVIVDNNEEITTGNDATEMCSSGADVAVEMCSPESHDTCGDGCETGAEKLNSEKCSFSII